MTNWLNNNEGVLAVAIFVLSLVGVLIKRIFFNDATKNHIQKQKSGDNSVNIQSGRDTNYGDK